jgi:hypothetical protein
MKCESAIAFQNVGNLFTSPKDSHADGETIYQFGYITVDYFSFVDVDFLANRKPAVVFGIPAP